MIQNNSAVIYRQPLNKTFATAFNGIRYFFTTERNGKIQLAVAVFTILTGLYLQLSAVDWIFILFCIAVVIGFEILNCALEHLCNLVHKGYHPAIKIIKDVAAGAVLFVSAISVVIGLMIFIPKILVLL
jgi:diacylglycerol kinase